MSSTHTLRRLLGALLPALALCACGATGDHSTLPDSDPEPSRQESTMQIQYLEIVSSDADATCATLAAVHGVTFSDPKPALGNARVASLATGGRISVRAPMAEHETPVVRPYALVDDIAAAIESAEAAGAQFAMYATELPGEGTFAIYMLGGIQHGLWQD